MKKVLALLLIGLMVILSGCDGSKKNGTDSKTIRVSLILGTNSDWYMGLTKWQERVDKESNGRIRIQIYPNASLANNNQRTELDMVQSGAIDASLESTITLSTLNPSFTAFSIPWLFPDYKKAAEVCDGPVGEKFLSLLPEKNLVGLAYGVNGFRQITNNKREIKSPADLKGLKIRIPLIKMYIDFFKLYGADPSSMNFGELMTALASGTMDGQENPVHVLSSAKLYEIQKYCTVWNYSYDPLVLCINKNFYEQFSPADQEMLKKTAQEAFSLQRDYVAQHEVETLEELKGKGMKVTVLTPAQLEPFKKSAQPIYNQYRREIGVSLMDEMIKAAQ
jgi:tripartite ATP-independent transporter DctP family solute receptor